MATKQLTGNKAPDGAQYVVLTDGAGNLGTTNTGTPATTVTTPADGQANSGNVSQTEIALNEMYNGTTWDLVRNLQGSSQTIVTGIPCSVNIPHSATRASIAASFTATANSAQVLKASAGALYSVSCAAGASAGYLLVFNLTAAPADGVVTPIDAIPVAANGYVTKAYNIPLQCSTGITIVFSTTGPFSKTASATAFLMGQAV